MSGILLSVVPKRVVDFSTLLAPGPASEDLILADRVEITPWREVTVRVRLHSLSMPANASIQVLVFPQSYTTEEPGLTFLANSSTDAAPFTTSTAAPTMVAVALPMLSGGPFASLARVVARGVRGATAGTIQAALSVDFAVKDT